MLSVARDSLEGQGKRAVRWALLPLSVTIFALSVTSGTASASVDARAHARADSPATPLGVEPYSDHPSGTKPYFACPAPTKTRATCDAIAVPAEAMKAVHRDRKAYGFGGRGPATIALEGSGVNGGFAPADLLSAYKLSESGGKGSTIAIVGAWDNPTAESDLATYRSHYGLPACTTENGCFKKVNQKGESKNYPTSAYEVAEQAGWALEASLDVDMASAVCPECNILLVEADSTYTEDLYVAENTAAELGATVISDSWGTREYADETEADPLYFNHPGVPIFVSSGDSGYGTFYPSASADVVSVGGTSLFKDEGKRGWREKAWSGAGSGCSLFEKKPAWQTDKGCSNRTLTDVSAVADVNTPVSVYSSEWIEQGSEEIGWVRLGGTSVSAPVVAASAARSSTEERAEGAALYWKEGPEGKLFDVAEGRNGHCSPEAEYLCAAKVGYDGPTGWGTPGGSLPAAPVVSANDPTGVTLSKASLNGAINPNGKSTTYRFEYGTSEAYGTSVPVPEGNVGSGSAAVEVSQQLTGLTPRTTYHYRLVATNSEGTTYSGDHSFITTRWSPQFVQPSRASKVTDISCSSATSCIVVGERFMPFEEGGNRGVDNPLAETWNGSKWAMQEIPAPHEVAEGYFSWLESVSCSAPTACTAVGRKQEFYEGKMPLAERWDGAKWSIQSTPAPSGEEGFDAELYGVACPSSAFCIGVGAKSFNEVPHPKRAFAESWDGSKWAIVTAPHPEGATASTLENVSCTSSTACTAVGFYIVEGVEKTLVERWDGAKWSIQASPNVPSVPNLLEDVSCTA